MQPWLWFNSDWVINHCCYQEGHPAKIAPVLQKNTHLSEVVWTHEIGSALCYGLPQWVGSQIMREGAGSLTQWNVAIQQGLRQWKHVEWVQFGCEAVILGHSIGTPCIVCADLYDWCRPDKQTSESGAFMILVNAAMCAPWVAWIGANAVVHFVWVGTLLGCQIYQVDNCCSDGPTRIISN